MVHIALDEANAWFESTKLALSEVDEQLESQVVSLLFSRLAGTYPTTSWIDEATTPDLIRTLIAMSYAAWYYDRTYSDDSESNEYAALLRRYIEDNISGLLSGSVTIIEIPTDAAEISQPTFFPNDLSSANNPTSDNPSDGGPSFMMGSIF
jgi:hypothetical protein